MKKVMVTLEAAESAEKRERKKEIYDYWLPFYKRQYERMLHGTGCKSYRELVERMKGNTDVKDPEVRVRWDIFHYMPFEAKYGDEGNLLYGIKDAEIDTILRKLIKAVAS